MELNPGITEGLLCIFHPIIVYNLCKGGQHSQGSEDWINQRIENAKNGEISASRAAPYVNLGNKESATLAYQRQTKQKRRQESDFGKAAMQFGIDNEPEACSEFEVLCRPKKDVLAFGLLRHRFDGDSSLLPESLVSKYLEGESMVRDSLLEEGFLDETDLDDPLKVAGSPDGATPGATEVRDPETREITQFNEVPFLIEIKCPFRREFTGEEVPGHYLVQVQQCMHIMRLETTSFIQYQPESKGCKRMTVIEVVRDPEWWTKVSPNLKKWSNHIATFEHNKETLGLEKAIELQPEECKRAPRKRRTKRAVETEVQEQKKQRTR